MKAITYKTATGAQVSLTQQGSKMLLTANGKTFNFRLAEEDAKLGFVIRTYNGAVITVPADAVASVKSLCAAQSAAIVAEAEQRYADSYDARAKQVAAQIARVGGND